MLGAHQAFYRHIVVGVMPEKLGKGPIRFEDASVLREHDRLKGGVG